MTMFLTILGSSAALPINSRRCSAQVLNVNGFKLLIDCAEGTQDRIRQYHLRLQSLNTIIISHMHGDHFFGLPGLLSTMHLCGRTEPITIVAPKGAREVVETTFELTGNHVDYPIEWVELDFTEGMQRVFANSRCTVDAFPLVHTVPTYGYRITEVPRNPYAVEEGRSAAPRVYAYCCDTAYDEKILPYVEGANLLCVECTFANELAELAEQRCHMTAGQAGMLARKAGVKQLLLTHISARYREPEILVQQASEEYGNCILAADGMRVEIRNKPTVPTMQDAVAEQQ